MLLLSDSINELDEERNQKKKQQQLKTNMLSLVINMRIFSKTPRLIKTWVQSPERGSTLKFDLNRYVPLSGVWFLAS